ncbi:MAG: inorganic pyrophosphatase [Firmicutes bacterium HGW-Firmicutes-10]|jgi:inorganic pyrophosphatase|nr:inorganic pyrophosphatase [Erysipelotrichaceae bacterium]PKM88775.1 MAG: inorganic pyrophosphatase [Firmicutes bacterium HGW-Firmicutes-10]
MIGEIVRVIIDRPLGSYHPEHKELYYPINYGYIDGIFSFDKEEQDAYVLGLNEPVDEFTGVIIAIVHRLNDIEDKWVVAPIDKSFTKSEIIEMIRFQEQYFQSDVITEADMEVKNIMIEREQ